VRWLWTGKSLPPIAALSLGVTCNPPCTLRVLSVADTSEGVNTWKFVAWCASGDPSPDLKMLTAELSGKKVDDLALSVSFGW